MLENKKARFVISFILAFALWFYVVGQMNPPMKKTYRDITITLTNEQSLNDSGLAVLNSSEDSLRVTVSGKRSAVNKLSKADIVATVDLTNAAEGTNTLPIDLKIPENIEIDNQSLNEITVKVEDRITSTIPVTVKYLGEYPEGSEPTTIKVAPNHVKISGASSLVEKVAAVTTEIDTANMPDELSSAVSSLTPVSSSGNQVRNISMTDTQCTVTSIMYKTKSVKLTVPVKDESDDKLKRTVSCQDKIMIKGQQSDLASISKIKAKTVNITDIKENTEITVKPVLPDGVLAADQDKNIKLTVKVSNK